MILIIFNNKNNFLNKILAHTYIKVSLSIWNESLPVPSL